MSTQPVPMACLVQAIHAAASDPRLLDPWVRTHDAAGAVMELARRFAKS